MDGFFEFIAANLDQNLGFTQGWLNWRLVLKSGWLVFWVTSAYSYLSCGFVGIVAGFRTRGDQTFIDAQIEKFVISPIYVGTFFSLFAILFLWQGIIAFHTDPNSAVSNMVAIGVLVFLGHTFLELAESTIVRRNPLRILDDPDALRLSGIYLLIIAMVVIVAFVSEHVANW